MAAILLLRGNFTADGAVRLTGADIAGRLRCSGARLTGQDQDGNGLLADKVKVGGDVVLEGGFTADGAVRLTGADIAGTLRCRGAQLKCCGQPGTALYARGVRVGGDVLLAGNFTADGAVRLTGADIAGRLRCSDARLTGKDRAGNSLLADKVKVGGDVLLDGGFTTPGNISLTSARAGTLRWAPAGQIPGQVNLEGAAVGELFDDWGPGRHDGHWPTDGRLRLDGFTYGRFGGANQADVKQRLEWIRGQYQQRAGWAARAKHLLTKIGARHHLRTGDNRANFATQPYEQLAAVYRQAGQDDDARKVAIARRADKRKYGQLNPYRWLGNWFLDWSVKYGYQTWRAGVMLAAVFVIFLVFSFVAQRAHLMVPVGDTEGLHYVPSAAKCTSNYPCFYPLGYAIDTVIPLINVHQAAYWGPDGHAPWGHAWVAGTWVTTGFGWALATLLVAGYTGLARRD